MRWKISLQCMCQLLSMAAPSNHTKYAALWLLGRGYSYKEVAVIHEVSKAAVRRWKQNEERIRNKNRDDLIKHLSPKP